MAKVQRALWNITAALAVVVAHAELLDQIGQQNPGLPDECLTFLQRYDEQLLDHKLQNLDLGPSRNAVVLLKLHGLHGGLRSDQALAFKALAVEVMEAGYEFVILHQQVHELPVTRFQALDMVPAELHQYVVFHDFKADLANYPDLRTGLLDHLRAGGGQGPGPALAYLGTMEFMLRYEAYEWLWEIEYDVRLVGHWGNFLNAALHIANAHAGVIWGTDPTWFSGATLEIPHNASMNAYRPWSEDDADLVNFQGISYGDKWNDTQINLSHQHVPHAAIMVWGASRRLFQAMSTMTAEGKGAYIETLLYIVALEHGLKTVPIKLPQINESWHCCTPTASKLYQDWTQANDCMHTVLMHPVKNLGSGWSIDASLTQLP